MCQAGPFATPLSIAPTRGFRVDGDIIGIVWQFVVGTGNGDFITDHGDGE